MGRYALGLDFGTESVRVLAVDCATGHEAAQAVRAYPHGVITERLPGGGEPLPPEFALQHPGDYEAAAREALGEVLGEVPPGEILGIGVDFTACTMLPVLADGTPLMELEAFRREPHAWVKLWKHRAAQPEADEVARVARERGEGFLRYYNGAVSSEWMLPKCWEIARRAPSVYDKADLFVDAGDWIVHRLTGTFVRNACAAGYKGLWNGELGFPSREFLAALDPALAGLGRKWLHNIVPAGRAAGRVTPAFAAASGLRAGTPVSAATIDAHSGVPGMGVSEEGVMSIIAGTSSCHMVLARELRFIEGCAGVVEDGILPGFYGYESGQAAVGDVFGWFARDFMGGGDDPFAPLARAAARMRPGENGLLALDWWGGNRSVLMDSRLSGMVAGLTLATGPAQLYRALLEACAFGTRRIIDSYREGGIPIEGLVLCGGLAADPLIMQILADVTGLPLRVAASDQAVALGAAIFGALAAGAGEGGHDRVEAAIGAMTRPPVREHVPDEEAGRVYDRLYDLYRRCHDFFGREQPDIMRTLKEIRDQALLR